MTVQQAIKKNRDDFAKTYKTSSDAQLWEMGMQKTILDYLPMHTKMLSKLEAKIDRLEKRISKLK